MAGEAASEEPALEDDSDLPALRDCEALEELSGEVACDCCESVVPAEDFWAEPAELEVSEEPVWLAVEELPSWADCCEEGLSEVARDSDCLVEPVELEPVELEVVEVAVGDAEESSLDEEVGAEVPVDDVVVLTWAAASSEAADAWRLSEVPALMASAVTLPVVPEVLSRAIAGVPVTSTEPSAMAATVAAVRLLCLGLTLIFLSMISSFRGWSDGAPVHGRPRPIGRA